MMVQTWNIIDGVEPLWFRGSVSIPLDLVSCFFVNNKYRTEKNTLNKENTTQHNTTHKKHMIQTKCNFQLFFHKAHFPLWHPTRVEDPPGCAARSGTRAVGECGGPGGRLTLIGLE